MPFLNRSTYFPRLLRRVDRKEGGVADASVSEPEEGPNQVPLENELKEQAHTALTFWLKRPYFDLKPVVPDGDPQTMGLLLALESVVKREDRARIHGVYPDDDRKDMIKQSRLFNYHLTDPALLPFVLRTDEWNILLDNLLHWRSDPKQHLRTMWLLRRMLLGEAVLKYSNDPSDTNSWYDAELMLIRGMASHSFLGSDDGRWNWLSHQAGLGSWAAVEATYLLSASAAKGQRDVATVRYWTNEHKLQVDARCNFVYDHELCVLRSRYHRVRAFLPQLEGDYKGMFDEMSEAELWANEISRDTIDHKTEAQVVTFAMLESRSKEALLLGDLDLAEHRARKAIVEAPLSPRGYMALGLILFNKKKYIPAAEVYLKAARYGPPSTAEAYFAAGQCYKKIGDLESERDAYILSLEHDPFGTTSLEELRRVATNLCDNVLLRWINDS